MPFDVSLRSGLEYDRKALSGVLRGMIEETGGWPERIRPGARVLLKVNMLAAKAPVRGITTHPEVVAAMALLLQEMGCTVAAGDSPGGAVRGIERYWRNCGYETLVADPGIELVSFEKAGSVERSVGPRVYHISKPMYDFDAVINMCKFKTHMYCRLTNAVKNSFGAVPGLGKAVIHSHAVRPRDLASYIVDIYSLVRFDLTVMDAILSLDGRGPSTDGRVRPDGVMAVARDGVELDMVMSELVGLGAGEVETTREALRRGLGRPREEITVSGSATFDGFQVPGNWFYNLVPGFAGTLVRWALKAVPRSNSKCTGCGFCARGCPVDAIRIVDGRARMSRRKCIACLCCHELCPENAIDLDLPMGRK